MSLLIIIHLIHVSAPLFLLRFFARSRHMRIIIVGSRKVIAPFPEKESYESRNQNNLSHLVLCVSGRRDNGLRFVQPHASRSIWPRGLDWKNHARNHLLDGSPLFEEVRTLERLRADFLRLFHCGCRHRDRFVSSFQQMVAFSVKCLDRNTCGNRPRQIGQHIDYCSDDSCAEQIVRRRFILIVYSKREMEKRIDHRTDRFCDCHSWILFYGPVVRSDKSHFVENRSLDSLDPSFHPRECL